MFARTLVSVASLFLLATGCSILPIDDPLKKFVGNEAISPQQEVAKATIESIPVTACLKPGEYCRLVVNNERRGIAVHGSKQSTVGGRVVALNQESVTVSDAVDIRVASSR